jgi:AraC-like ligand binding domain
MNLVHIDQLDSIEIPDGFVWRPVRRHFGIRSFGTNAYAPGETGQIVEEHTEEPLGHEEIYLVLRGRVRFRIGDDEHELGQGQLVFVRDPSLRRGAVAVTDDAAVLAVGGKPGEPHEISAWEYIFPSLPARTAGDWSAARTILEHALAEADRPAIHYHLACVEARAGNNDRALEELRVAVERRPALLEPAQTDDDLASIRDDPRFPSL